MHLFTLASYIISMVIYLNLTFFISPILGSLALIFYFLINAVFLGHAIFGREGPFLRMMLGSLLLIMLLSILGWMVMIIYNLDTVRFTLVLLMATTVSSLANKRMRGKNGSK